MDYFHLLGFITVYDLPIHQLIAYLMLKIIWITYLKLETRLNTIETQEIGNFRLLTVIDYKLPTGSVIDNYRPRNLPMLDLGFLIIC